MDYTKINNKYGKINTNQFNLEYKLIGKGVQGSVYLIRDHKNKNKFISKITRQTFGKYDSYREMHFSEMTNKVVQYGGFLEYYDTQIINSTVYMSMEAADGDLIQWSKENRSVDDWKSMLYQLVIAVIRMQKLGIIHNDLQAKNILFKNNSSELVYKIKNKKYNFRTKHYYYISDFGISAHNNLEINLISKEQMKRPNYDLKKFSQIPNKLRSINVTNRLTYDELVNKLKNLEDMEYKDKIKRLENKIKDWQLPKEDKKEYIHLHLAYYYVKRGYFKDDYMVGAPLKIPNEIEKMFIELRNWTTSLDDWLEKYM